MSSQKFSAIEREAVWRIYDEKCAYTRGRLDISNFHIDHILPETLLDDPAELKKALDACGLDASFDILGWENLVPCQPGANLQKSSSVFDPTYVRFYLGVAGTRKAAVLEEIQKIEKARKRGKAIIALEQLLETGKLSHEDAARILRDQIGEPEKIFELVESMSFEGSKAVHAVRRASR
jgi:hypothetical protein